MLIYAYHISYPVNVKHMKQGQETATTWITNLYHSPDVRIEIVYLALTTTTQCNNHNTMLGHLIDIYQEFYDT